MLVGFLLATYSVLGNDCVQTLGTFMASNSNRFKWYTLWLSASVVMVATMFYGWYFLNDISFGRLNKFPEITIEWYHALAPLALVILTRMGIPVSTTFLVLSTFATSVVLEKMLMKSVMGYGVAAIVAYAIWIVVAKVVDRLDTTDVRDITKPTWRVLQWLSTGFLWSTWLLHDMANIAIFLPREMSGELFTLVMMVLIGGLGWIFYERGGKIQNIVIEKTSTKYVRSATIIDLVYALILLYFKQYNDIPMSTSWVFIGLLCGRELAIGTIMSSSGKLKQVFPLIGRDFLKMVFGLLVSVAIVLMINML